MLRILILSKSDVYKRQNSCRTLSNEHTSEHRMHDKEEKEFSRDIYPKAVIKKDAEKVNTCA